MGSDRYTGMLGWAMTVLFTTLITLLFFVIQALMQTRTEVDELRASVARTKAAQAESRLELFREIDWLEARIEGRVDLIEQQVAHPHEPMKHWGQ